MPFCSICGTETQNQQKFCKKCGGNLQKEEIQSTSDNSLESVESKKVQDRAKNLNKRFGLGAVFLVLVGICIYLLVPSNGRGESFDANKSNAVQIANWLKSQGYCSVLNDWASPFEWDKNLAKQQLIADCDDGGERYAARKGLDPNYPTTSGIRFYIYSGKGRFDESGSRYENQTKLNVISGENWDISVGTDEVPFPGAFEDAKRIMKSIADSLKGTLRPDYQPSDYCTVNNDYVTSRKSDDSKFEPTLEDKVAIAECRKYFPEAFQLNVYRN